MGSEWANYAILAVLTILSLGALHKWNESFKSDGIKKLFHFRKKLFGLRKELFLLNQKKKIHDSKVESFLLTLKVPKGRGVTVRKINLTLNKKEKEFQELLESESFLLLCKERVFELIKELEILNDKFLKTSLKKYLDNSDNGDYWSSEISKLREGAESFKDNYNVLNHSFSAFQEESRKRLLGSKETV